MFDRKDDGQSPVKSEFAHLVGKTFEEARDAAEQDGYSIRVRMDDNQPQMGTADVQTKRINVAMEDGIVVSIMSLG